MSAVAIVLAAGAGERVGRGVPKAFLGIGGRPMLLLATAAAAAARRVVSLVVAVPEGEEDGAGAILGGLGKPCTVVTGGATRHRSVRRALEVVGPDVEAVVCHDAARPFAPPNLFDAVLAALGEADGVVPVLPVADTVKLVEGGWVVETVPRDRLVVAQTPQAFRAAALRDAHARAGSAGESFTDDAAVLEWAGYRVWAVPGDPGNFKVTTEEDLVRAEALAAGAARG